MNIISLRVTIVLLLTVIVISIRLATFGGPFLWYDELLTVTRIAGWNLRALENYLSFVITSEPQSVTNLSKYLSTRPDAAILDDIIVLFKQGVLPFYYILTKLWVRLGNDSIWWLQVFSWLLGLTNILVATSICRLLVEDKIKRRYVTLIIGIIYCTSPFHIIYSREIRSYSLIIFILLSSYYCFEYFKKYKSNKAYIGFLLLLITGMHIHVLFLIAAFTYFVRFLPIHFDSAHQQIKITRQLLYFVGVLVLGLVWPLCAIIFNADPFHFSSARIDLLSWLVASLWSIASIYCDLPFSLYPIYVSSSGFQLDLCVVLVALLVVISVLWAIANKFYRDLGVFVVMPIIVLAALDIFFNGQRLTISRYLFMTSALSPVAVTLFLTNYCWHKNKIVRSFTMVSLVILLITQVISTYYLSLDSYRGKPDPSLTEYAEVMQRIKELDYSVLYTQETTTSLLAMAPYFKSDVILAGALGRMNQEIHMQRLLDYTCTQKKRVGIISRVSDLSFGPVIDNQISRKLRYVREYHGRYFDLGVLVCSDFTK